MSGAFETYAAIKMVILADRSLTEGEKGEEITRLTSELEEEEAKLGIAWVPISSVTITEATASGSATMLGEDPTTDGRGA